MCFVWDLGGGGYGGVFLVKMDGLGGGGGPKWVSG